MQFTARCSIALQSVILSLVAAGGVLADVAELTNGDRISGEVLRMEEGVLFLRTSYAGDLSIQWKHVGHLWTDAPMRVMLRDGTLLNGKALRAEPGSMRIRLENVVQTLSFGNEQVATINPTPPVAEQPVKVAGKFNVGLSSTTGNTKTSDFHGDGEIVARTAQNRYTLGGEVNRAKEEGDKTVDNALAYLKYDHFLDGKWYLFNNATFETDDFKDLDLRSTIGAGIGYQFQETERSNLSFELGVNYVNEDYEKGGDERYGSGRWSVNWDRYFLRNTLQLFHFHEGLVSIEDTKDVFVRSRTGLRLPLLHSFLATAQLNCDWDNSPASDRRRTDTEYLFSLGYTW